MRPGEKFGIRYTKLSYPNDLKLEQQLTVDRKVDVYGIDFASDRLRPESAPVLAEIAGILEKNGAWKLNINGHTDNVGGDASNLTLSRLRAAAVKSALAERYKIEAGRLSTGGFGASEPQATNDTPEGLARNRRVELSGNDPARNPRRTAMNLIGSRIAIGALPAAILVLTVALAGCGASKQKGGIEPASAERNAPSAEAAVALARAQKPTAKACEMVAEAEMTRILGTTVTAKDLTHSSGETDCKWAAPSGFPAVELEMDWGDGEVAMGAASAMNRHEPGITSPYEGIGDQAIAVGPALMIKTGDDLMQLTFTGVEDAPLKAKKIFDTAKPRM